MYTSQNLTTRHITDTQKSLLIARKLAGFVSQTTACSKHQEMIANSFRRAEKCTKRESRCKNVKQDQVWGYSVLESTPGHILGFLVNHSLTASTVLYKPTKLIFIASWLCAKHSISQARRFARMWLSYARSWDLAVSRNGWCPDRCLPLMQDCRKAFTKVNFTPGR